LLKLDDANMDHVLPFCWVLFKTYKWHFEDNKPNFDEDKAKQRVWWRMWKNLKACSELQGVADFTDLDNMMAERTNPFEGGEDDSG